MKRLGTVLLALLLAGAVQAQDCKPSPLGQRELYLRGSFNNWSATEESRFSYVCDRYELYLRIAGEHSFKVADEDWSPDADFGGQAGRLELKGPALSRRFEGGPVQKLVLRMGQGVLGQAGSPAQLSIAPFDGPIPQLAAAPGLSDPVALSLRFDSCSLAHKTPFGAITAGSEVSFALTAAPGVEQATLVIEKRRLEGNQELLEYDPIARLPMTRTASGWRAAYRFAEKAIYGYHFELGIKGKRYVYQNNRDNIYWTREKGSMGLGAVDEMPDSVKRIRRYRQTVYAADFTVPAWARDAVYYYLFPERFRNGDKTNDPMPGVARYHDKRIETHKRWSEKPYKPAKPGEADDGSDAHYNNDFFGGDLAGIIEKLDYIKELGANTIYLTPVFRAASNHKYDTADYRQIDPGFGSNADFERLTAEAAKRGLRVIPDTSLNHVGSDSPYFNRFGNFAAGGAFDGGKINPASAYADWFTIDATQQEADKQYKGWVGVADLPELNKASKSFRAFAYGGKRLGDAVLARQGRGRLAHGCGALGARRLLARMARRHQGPSTRRADHRRDLVRCQQVLPRRLRSTRR